jgi:hypothetical protein
MAEGGCYNERRWWSSVTSSRRRTAEKVAGQNAHAVGGELKCFRWKRIYMSDEIYILLKPINNGSS